MKETVKSCLSCVNCGVYKKGSSKDTLIIIDCDGRETVIPSKASLEDISEFIEAAKDCEGYRLAK